MDEIAKGDDEERGRMSVNDPISDMLTRIRNAGMARQTETTMPSTKILVAIAIILKQEGYISDYRVIERRPQDQLVISLRYGADRKPAIHELKRVSKPGLRVYAGKDDIPRVKSGLGIAIVSTPQGVLTGYEARRRGIGGEVLCTVF
jgi:small subunit ribosomal protein S8